MTSLLRYFAFVVIVSTSFGMEKEKSESIKGKWSVARSFAFCGHEIRTALFDRTGEMIFLGGTNNLAVLILHRGDLRIPLRSKTVESVFTDLYERCLDCFDDYCKIINKAAFNPQKDEIGVIFGKDVFFYDYAGQIIETLKHKKSVIDIAYNEGGTHVATALLDGTIFIKMIGEESATRVESDSPLHSVEFIPSIKDEALLILGDYLIINTEDEEKSIPAKYTLPSNDCRYKIQQVFYDAGKQAIAALAYGLGKDYRKPCYVLHFDENLTPRTNFALFTKIVTINRLKHEILLVQNKIEDEKQLVIITDLDKLLLEYRTPLAMGTKIVSAIAGNTHDRLILLQENGFARLWEFKKETPE